MQSHSRRQLLALATIALLVAGCSKPQVQAATQDRPATVESAGGNLSRITLTSQAAKRLGIEMAAVSKGSAPGSKGGTTVPYGAVLYDPKGTTWVYTNPQPLVFVRAPIRVDRIVGNEAILVEGPAVGTLVVVVGAPELFGTEFGIGH